MSSARYDMTFTLPQNNLSRPVLLRQEFLSR
jgi:hypothetical protein